MLDRQIVTVPSHLRGGFALPGSPLFCEQIKSAKTTEMTLARLEIAERTCRESGSTFDALPDVRL
jgi:hypothetical protein